jgi:hypothetical protein
VKVISQNAVFDKVGYRPHPGQVPILSDPHRFRVTSAGRRFGKSNMGGHILTPEAYRAFFMREKLEAASQRHEYWIIGPEYSDAEKEFRIIYDDLKRLGMPFDRPGTYNDAINGNLHISLWGGRFQVHGKSAKYPETLVGEGLSGALLVEAAKLKERVWTKFIRPTLGDFHGWAWFSSTPEGRNWFYRLWQDGQDPDNEEWASWRAPAWNNPHVYPGGRTDPEIISVERDLSKAMFAQEYAADFNEFVGRVFGDFDEEVHVRTLNFDPERETYAASDYGFTNPAVWLLVQVDINGRVYVLDEVYGAGMTIPEFAAAIRAKGLAPSGMKMFYPDPALPGESKQLSEILRIPIGRNTGGELKDRIEWIRRALKFHPNQINLEDDHPEKLPMLVIDRKCVNTISDMNSYRYPKSAEEAKEQKTNLPENPLKKDDHAPEALGRFFAGKYGAALRGRARQTTARVG